MVSIFAGLLLAAFLFASYFVLPIASGAYIASKTENFLGRKVSILLGVIVAIAFLFTVHHFFSMPGTDPHNRY